MALPQRREDPAPPPPEAQPELEDMQRNRVEREVSSGWRFGFWWVWILIIVGIWYVGFGWGGSGGWLRHHQPTVHTADTQFSGPGVAALTATNKHVLVGQAFQVHNVPVDRPASPRAFWIGNANNTNPMLLVLTGAATYTQGDRLDVSGQILAPPPAAQAQQQWGISAQDAALVDHQGAYILASAAQLSRR